MTDQSARFALPLLQPGQAQKEMFHNEALARIDAALHASVVTIGLNTPPATPLTGQAWIVGDLPLLAWNGQAGRLATWTSGGWRFVAPVTGMTAWLQDGSRWIWYDGDHWRQDALPCAGIAVNGKRIVGPRLAAINNPAGGTVIDNEARLTVAAMLAALRQHGLIDT